MTGCEVRGFAPKTPRGAPRLDATGATWPRALKSGSQGGAAAATKFFLLLFWQLPSRPKIKKVRKNKEFFFEKKNQKTFAPLREVVLRPLAKIYRSFFASFCSQKRRPS
jgi:hypothetical protein